MLERFYDPKSGSIELDGVNIKQLNVSHLRSAIGYVGQEPTLFATSIRANIQYGNPEATFEQIQEAARLANAHDFISAFSDGYDTQVGDKGSQLSGGQKQRIAIARVLVGKPRILILDEATSALDSESELVVQEALDNILENQKITTVIVAHRLSTIRGCDIINVLVNGVVVESGTHDELMSKLGYYSDLVNKQDGTDSGMGSKSSSAADLEKLVESEASPEALVSDISQESFSLYSHVSFKNVAFAYPTRPKKIVFDGFNLDIERGATVALVGPSGGGKSTTVGLIERFYDPLSGTVEYEGTDIKTLNLQWYRDQIGYVGQEPTLCKYMFAPVFVFHIFYL
jgi:ATP-binding cassette, subfamily B (MDR/TAP), member 1